MSRQEDNYDIIVMNSEDKLITIDNVVCDKNEVRKTKSLRKGHYDIHYIITVLETLLQKINTDLYLDKTTMKYSISRLLAMLEVERDSQKL